MKQYICIDLKSFYASVECVEGEEFGKVYETPEGFTGYIDRSSNEAVIGF